MKCEDCKYFGKYSGKDLSLFSGVFEAVEDYIKKIGSCRRYPQVVHVTKDYGCGEFKEREYDASV